jgi:glycosyltransferase involved in cell wall biosynthesis
MPSDPSARRLDPACRVGMLSTYPPSHCGLATFSAALVGALNEIGDRITVVAIDDGGPLGHPSLQRLHNGSAASIAAAVHTLSGCDAVIVQHEYGIFGGPDGDEVLELLAAIDAPAIVVLHTVPLQPTDHQRFVLEGVCDLAARVVVMTRAAGDRLLAGYEVDDTKVVTIAHGATPPALGGPRPPIAGQPLELLTWGLLGPGKGIEHVIDAIAALGDDRRRIRYTLAGATHPKVFARDGDQYRQSLIARCRRLGVSDVVTFDDTYRTVPDLMQLVGAASLVVLPYDSRDQVTSGVLIDAIAAGRPVIATAFPHAVELLDDGAGLVVPHGDPAALASAIRRVLDEPMLLPAMVSRARWLAPSLRWRTVGAKYQQLCETLGLAATASA